MKSIVDHCHKVIFRFLINLVDNKNVFNNIHKNPTFLIVLVVTFISQVIIVQFGSVVFGLDPNGLSGANWGISIALGTGSLFVGFLIRLLPEFNIPLGFLGGTLSSKEDEPVPVIVEVPSNSGPTSPQDRWRFAIEKVKEQNEIDSNARTTIFALPGKPRTSSSAARSSKEIKSAEHNWNILRRYIVTSIAFKKARGSFAQDSMVDPRRKKAAQIALASSRHNH